jgi:hypothetical protein
MSSTAGRDYEEVRVRVVHPDATSLYTRDISG